MGLQWLVVAEKKLQLKPVSLPLLDDRELKRASFGFLSFFYCYINSAKGTELQFHCNALTPNSRRPFRMHTLASSEVRTPKNSRVVRARSRTEGNALCGGLCDAPLYTSTRAGMTHAMRKAARETFSLVGL